MLENNRVGIGLLSKVDTRSWMEEICTLEGFNSKTDINQYKLTYNIEK